jgi:hypothetical protein
MDEGMRLLTHAGMRLIPQPKHQDHSTGANQRDSSTAVISDDAFSVRL